MEHKELYTSLIPPECRRSVSFSKEGDVYVKNSNFHCSAPHHLLFSFCWTSFLVGFWQKWWCSENQTKDMMSIPFEKHWINYCKIIHFETSEHWSLHVSIKFVFLFLEEWSRYLNHFIKTKEPSKRPTFQRICVELNRMLKVNIDLELFAQSIYSCFNIDRFTMCSMSDSIGRKLVHQYCIFGNFDGLKELVRMEGKEILNEVDMYETNCAHFAGLMFCITFQCFPIWFDQIKKQKLGMGISTS